MLVFAEVREALGRAEPDKAWQLLRPALDYPAHMDVLDWSTALRLLAAVLRGLGVDAALTQRVAATAEAPEDTDRLFDLGYHLIEAGLPDVAAATLGRALALDPRDPLLLSELSCALDDDFRFWEARAVLEAHPDLTAAPTLTRYLLAYHTLMTGDLEGCRVIVDGLIDTADDAVIAAAGQLDDMLARADAVVSLTPLDTDDLRGWHFVLNGGLLLHRSPHKREIMHGRYGLISESEALLAQGIALLQRGLNAAHKTVDRVFYVPDRASTTLAMATALVLGVPALAWPREGSPLPGLIVVHDLADLSEPVAEQLATHRQGQILWGHASQWTARHPIAADVVTTLYQSNQGPWTPPDPTAEAEPPEQVAARIASLIAPPDATESAQVEALAGAAKRVYGAAMPGIIRIEGRRRLQLLGSPVPSQRFG